MSRKSLVFASTRNGQFRWVIENCGTVTAFRFTGGLSPDESYHRHGPQDEIIPHLVPAGRRLQSHARPTVQADHRPRTIRIHQGHSKEHRMLAAEVVA